MKGLLRLILVLMMAITLATCKSGSSTGPDVGEDNPTDTLPGSDTTSWVLLAEGTFTAYERDITGDTVCDEFVLSWPRDAYDDPEGSRFPLNEPVYPGDYLRVFGRYEAGNDVGTFAFAGDTSNPGFQELALAVLPDTLRSPGDTASFAQPYGGTDTLSFYIVVAMIDNGNMRCRPNSTDSVRFYYRLEKRR